VGLHRDRHYGKILEREWSFSNRYRGLNVLGSDDVFEKEIDKQVELAIDEADAINLYGGCGSRSYR